MEGGAIGRDPALVFFGGIIGVPWQDIATAKTADTSAGQELEYMTAPQISANDIWDIILGDPDASPPEPPADPLMIESIQPRIGNNPVTGAERADPDAQQPLANPINGHEWNIVTGDDLQYACIFPLEHPRDCSDLDDPNEGCDCKDLAPGDNTPLCQNEDGTYGTTQYFAKAYPGIRHLQVLKGFGENSIVASICARNVDNPNAPDFGYRPAIGAIIDRLSDALSGACLPRTLTVRENGPPERIRRTTRCPAVSSKPSPSPTTAANKRAVARLCRMRKS